MSHMRFPLACSMVKHSSVHWEMGGQHLPHCFGREWPSDTHLSVFLFLEVCHLDLQTSIHHVFTIPMICMCVYASTCKYIYIHICMIITNMYSIYSLGRCLKYHESTKYPIVPHYICQVFALLSLSLSLSPSLGRCGLFHGGTATAPCTSTPASVRRRWWLGHSSKVRGKTPQQKYCTKVFDVVVINHQYHHHPSSIIHHPSSSSSSSWSSSSSISWLLNRVFMSWLHPVTGTGCTWAPPPPSKRCAASDVLEVLMKSSPLKWWKIAWL